MSADKKPISFSYNNTERCQSRCITCNGWKTSAECAKDEMTTEDIKEDVAAIPLNNPVSFNPGELDKEVEDKTEENTDEQ